MAETTSPLRGDVVVIGAGPAGLAAACEAAEAGRVVIVLDESIDAGGQIWRRDVRREPSRAAMGWYRRLEATKASLLLGTSVVSVRRRADDDFLITAERGETHHLVTARAVVLATGARERFVPFPGWTLPGVLGIGAAQALVKSGMDVAGRRVVIAGSGPLLLPVAASLARNGACLLEVAEQASRGAVVRFGASLWRQPSVLASAARYRAAFPRASYRTGTWVKSAREAGGSLITKLTDGTREREVTCDLLCVAFGLTPNAELARELGCATRDGFVVVDDDQRTSVPSVFCAGEPTRIGGVALALAEGEIAGRAAAGVAPRASAFRRRGRLGKHAVRLDAAFALRSEIRDLPTADTIVCRCEDVHCGEIAASWTSRQAKLYTRLGMGPCQGRICGAALQYLLHWAPDTIRSPVEPARVSTLLADAAAVDVFE